MMSARNLLRGAAILSPLALLCCSGAKATDLTAPAPSSSELLAPPKGEGFQLKTDNVVVPAGTESQDCYFFRVRDLAASNGMASDQPVYLHRVQAQQGSGSHHMNIFRVKTITGLDPANGVVQKAPGLAGACGVSSNWADWPIVANTQLAEQLDWTYPDGVANEFQPDEWLMLQTHYVNATTQTTPGGIGKVAANFWTMPAKDVKAQLGTIFAVNKNLRVCASNPNPSFEGHCQLDSTVPVTVIGANGHFHSRGKKFDMFAWDGSDPHGATPFYECTSWEEPPMMHSPGLNLELGPQGGVWFTAEYQWTPPDPAAGGCDALNQLDKAKHGTPDDQLDCCYTFGPSVDKNEHMNAFVYYYPKQDSVTCE